MLTLTVNDYSSIPSQAHKHHQSCHMMASYSKITRYLKTAFLSQTYCYPMTSTSHKAQRMQQKIAQKSGVYLCGLPAGEPQTCFPIIATFPPGSSSGVTVDGPKARECDLAFPPKVALRSGVGTLDEYFLIEQRVIGSQRACSIVVALVVMAQVSLS